MLQKKPSRLPFLYLCTALIPRLSSLLGQWLLALFHDPSLAAVFSQSLYHGSTAASPVAPGLTPLLSRRIRAGREARTDGLVAGALLLSLTAALLAFPLEYVRCGSLGSAAAVGLIAAGAVLTAASLGCLPYHETRGQLLPILTVLLMLGLLLFPLARKGKAEAVAVLVALLGSYPSLCRVRPVNFARIRRWAWFLARRSLPQSTMAISSAVLSAVSLTAALRFNLPAEVGKETLAWSLITGINYLGLLLASRRAAGPRGLPGSLAWLLGMSTAYLAAFLAVLSIGSLLPSLATRMNLGGDRAADLLWTGLCVGLTDYVVLYRSSARQAAGRVAWNLAAGLGLVLVLIITGPAVFGRLGVFGALGLLGLCRLAWVALVERENPRSDLTALGLLVVAGAAAAAFGA